VCSQKKQYLGEFDATLPIVIVKFFDTRDDTPASGDLESSEEALEPRAPELQVLRRCFDANA
jgi:hypothetical protein